MSLANWLKQNNELLTTGVSRILARSVSLKMVQHAGAEQFIEVFEKALVSEDGDALKATLYDWANTSAIAFDQVSTLIAIQDLFFTQIRQSFSPEDSIIHWQTMSAIFGEALIQLSEAVASAKLDNTRRRLMAEAGIPAEDMQKQKADFVSVASHELKTPLTLIEGYANMLEMILPADENPQSVSILAGLTKGTNRLREIIEDMIDMAQIQMDTLLYNRQQVWLTRLLDIATSEMSKIAETRNINLTLNVDNLPRREIEGDPERLYQVFVKILENAIKYTPDGGKITISGNVDEGFAIVKIQDTGIGIDSDKHEVIFEKFYTIGETNLHSSGKSKFKGGGTGLGLAIARGIIEAHNGTIWVTSEGYDEQHPKGSCFYIALPLQED